jgi:hypothetical protein
MGQIRRDLPNNAYEAAVGANNPSAVNVFATISDLTTPAYGPFGIADSTGLYTYYPDLYSAVTAALPGQVVEAFADFVETTNEVTLADQVDINLNGHTYTFDSTGSGSALTNAGSVGGSCKIYNGKILRINGAVPGDGHAVISIENVTFNIEMYGVTLTNNIGTTIFVQNGADPVFSGNFEIRTSALAPQNAVYGFNCVIAFRGATIFSDGICILVVSGSVTLDKSYFISLGSGAVSADGDVAAKNCQFYAVAGTAIQSATVELLNCNILSIGFPCITGFGEIAHCRLFANGASAISLSGVAGQGSIIFSNVIGAFLGRGVNASFTGNSHRISDNIITSIVGSGIVVLASNNSEVYVNNNDIQTSAASGPVHGISASRDAGSPNAVVNVTNNKVLHTVPTATAYALTSNLGSLSIYFSGNNFRTGNVNVYGPNVIQAQVNTIDNFGNILFG